LPDSTHLLLPVPKQDASDSYICQPIKQKPKIYFLRFFFFFFFFCFKSVILYLMHCFCLQLEHVGHYCNPIVESGLLSEYNTPAYIKHCSAQQKMILKISLIGI
jgi:hypothetical protein